MTSNAIREATVLVHGVAAGTLTELPVGRYRFSYLVNYEGPAVSLTLPLGPDPFEFDHFPPFFDGLLPEGWQLEALLRSNKLDPTDYMGQILAVGSDTVGAVTLFASVRESE